MRNLNLYDLIVCDIDDTLIYGFWTDLMRHTWDMFHSPRLSAILMALQDWFNLYRVNEKLRYMINNSKTPIVFLTVRAESKHTFNILNKILDPERGFELMALGTDYGFIEKPEFVWQQLSDNPDILLIDDSDCIRANTEDLGVDVLDPRLLLEGYHA